MSAGRSNNEHLRAGRNGRVTPQKQEQDPRRDVSGAIGKSKERLRSNPRKNRNQSNFGNACHQAKNTASAVPDEGTRPIQEKPGKPT
jgi:hypothetical protein